MWRVRPNFAACRLRGSRVVGVLVCVRLMLHAFRWVWAVMVFGCTHEMPAGRLLVESDHVAASVELYRASPALSRSARSSHLPPTLESYRTLSSGVVLSLPVGSYLVLAHCSHRWISIRESQTTTLRLYEVSFKKPRGISHPEKGVFDIRCQRYRKSSFPQHLKNTYQLHMLSGEHRLFVNMMPLTLSLGQEESSTTLELGAFRLPQPPQKYRASEETHHYFISTQEHDLALTRHVPLGTWVFALPGSYRVSLHGSSRSLRLTAGSTQQLPLSYLRLEAPPDLAWENHIVVGRTPYVAALLGEESSHDVEPHTTYPLFPGTFELRLGFSRQPFKLHLKQDTLTTLPLRALTVQSSCAAEDWKCLGRVDVLLYRKGFSTPLIEGASDMPLLYPAGSMQVLLSTALGLRKNLPRVSAAANHQIKLGRVVITPRLVRATHRNTELVRIETQGDDVKGASLDLSSRVPTTLQLIPGTYALTSYQTYEDQTAPHRQKRVQKKTFHLKAKQTLQLSAVFYHGMKTK